MMVETLGEIERAGGRVDFDHREGRTFARVSTPKSRWHWSERVEITGADEVEAARRVREAWKGAP